MLRKLILFVLVFNSMVSHSQKWEPLDRKIKEISNNRTKALKMAEDKDWIKMDTTGGRMSILVGVSKSGMPLYLTTYNANSAKTIHTDRVQGAESDFNLSGKGITVGVWDGGDAADYHQELKGRVTLMEKFMENPHATHVVGTIAAKGVNKEAKGMAPEAKVLVHAMGDDDVREMRDFINKSYTLSNHSYGSRAGWEINYISEEEGWKWVWFGDITISQEEDYKFGLYDNSSELWDGFAYSYPQYTIVKAAGNSRGWRRSDPPKTGDFYYHGEDGQSIFAATDQEPFPVNGPYDCIPTHSCAKNILTVGATNKVTDYTGPESVELAYFSSCGPTDDGRIKPDVMADGVDVLSCRNRGYDDYDYQSGTSMAAPAVTGSIALLQEYYKDLNNSVMNASLVKALVIHTAQECGEYPGPDYMFGWGLMNTEAAVKTIKSESTELLELDIKEEMEFNVLASGTEPLKVTMAWTDIPGVASDLVLDDRTPKLVNDMDLRIISDETYYPWILDVENPEQAATKGDNHFDNVEQVIVDEPEAKLYKVKISCKKGLEEAQTVSLVISGIRNDELEMPSSIQINDPAYGEAKELNFEMKNLGNQECVINSITATENISISNSVPVIAALQTTEVNLSTDIAMHGFIDGLIAVNYNDNMLKTVRVNGFVNEIGPEYPEELNFGDVKYNYSKTLNLSLRNLGIKTMNVTDILLPEHFTANVTEFELKSLESKTLQIKYKPQVKEEINEPLLLTVNGEELPITILNALCSDGPDPISTNVEDIVSGKNKIYPIPVQYGNPIHFEFADDVPDAMEFYSINGKLLLKMTPENTMSVASERLTRGMVLVKLIRKDLVNTIKIVIL